MGESSPPLKPFALICLRANGLFRMETENESRQEMGQTKSPLSATFRERTGGYTSTVIADGT